MFTLIIILIALIAVLITLVVLVQSGRGGGLAGVAAGGATQQILGTRQAPDVLEKATWLLASLFIVLCVVSNFAIGEGQAQESVIQQRAQEEQTTPAAPPVGERQELPTLPESTTPDPAPSEQAPTDPAPADE